VNRTRGAPVKNGQEEEEKEKEKEARSKKQEKSNAYGGIEVAAGDEGRLDRQCRRHGQHRIENAK
jgi:hypothetical protein